MLNFLRAFARAFVSELRGLFEPQASMIDIVEQDERQLVLRSRERKVVVNRRYKTVKSGSDVLARFDEIQSIDITHQSNDDGPETWCVSLSLGFLSSITIGYSTDDANASIAAARLSTFTGKKVRAL